MFLLCMSVGMCVCVWGGVICDCVGFEQGKQLRQPVLLCLCLVCVHACVCVCVCVCVCKALVMTI